MALHFVSTEGWSHDKWIMYRKDGVGASDFGVLLGLNKWKCSLQYFHELIGVKPMNNEMNFAQINGKAQEPIIANYFRYFEKDHATMVRNINAGKIVREVEEVGGYMYDTDLPNMFCSLDRKFKDARFGDKYCALEIKNESYVSHSMWEGRNPNQILQLAYQLLITKFPYGVLLAKVGDSELVADDMTYKQALKLKNTIVSTVTDFWDRVTRARVIMTQIYHAKSQYNMKLALELQQEIFRLEPPPQKNDAYLEYMSTLAKERHESVSIKGTDDHIAKAKELKKITEKRKKLLLQETEIKSYFADIFHKEEKTEISFGSNGKISFFGGRFVNSLK
jgi:hypothetical protein